MDHSRSIAGAGEDNVAIPDDLRCKRSDGKQWRCTAMSMPDKTVCEKHYIQAKKRAANSALKASMKKKRKPIGERDNYYESTSDDMDVPLVNSIAGDYSGSVSGKKNKEKLPKTQRNYSPEAPSTRSLTLRSSLKSNDELQRDGIMHEDNRRSYKTPPPPTIDSSRSRSQKMFDSSPMTVSQYFGCCNALKISCFYLKLSHQTCKTVLRRYIAYLLAGNHDTYCSSTSLRPSELSIKD